MPISRSEFARFVPRTKEDLRISHYYALEIIIDTFQFVCGSIESCAIRDLSQFYSALKKKNWIGIRKKPDIYAIKSPYRFCMCWIGVEKQKRLLASSMLLLTLKLVANRSRIACICENFKKGTRLFVLSNICKLQTYADNISANFSR